MIQEPSPEAGSLAGQAPTKLDSKVTSARSAGYIVLVEPFCRGSRLQTLAQAARAVLDKEPHLKIIVVTRRDYRSAHWTELLGAIEDKLTVMTAPTDLGNAWIRNLSASEFRLFLGVIELAIARVHPSHVIFMALDEYLVAFVACGFRLWQISRKCKLFAIKYRVEYLLHARSFKNKLLSSATKIALSISQSSLICYDERLQGKCIAGRQACIIPDPWHGNFSPSLRAAGRHLLGINDHEFVLLTLGRQDRRKGLPLLLDSISELIKEVENVRIVIVGKIDESLRTQFDFVLTQHGDRIMHRDGFVDERDLPAYFASADAFMLAYSVDFTATSGTLPRAAASGVPVIAASHGLVGYRVQKLGLGECFDIQSRTEFIKRVKAIARYGVEKRREVADSGLRFSGTCDTDTFNTKFSKILAQA